MATKYDLCSRAMVRVGGKPIASFEGAGTEEVVANQLYEPAVEELLSRYRWRFCAFQAQLSRNSTAPLGRWEAAYTLPEDAIMVHAVTVNDVPIEFDRYENDILCDALVSDVVICDYGYRANEAYWPGYFNALVELRLAADFSIPIADDATKAQYYEARTERYLSIAKTMDAQGRTAKKMPVGGFSRFSGARA